jgi:hypothetical protein
MIGTTEVWIAKCDFLTGCGENIQMESKDHLVTSLKLMGWKTNGEKTYCHIHALRTSSYKLENTDMTLINVHVPYLCAGRTCAIHNMTNHNMRSWKQNWRADRQFMERICPIHGTGEPDPDQWEYLVEKFGEDVAKAEFVHGCCGCAHKEEN